MTNDTNVAAVDLPGLQNPLSGQAARYEEGNLRGLEESITNNPFKKALYQDRQEPRLSAAGSECWRPGRQIKARTAYQLEICCGRLAGLA